MRLPTIGSLESHPARERPARPSPTAAAARASWEQGDRVAVVEIDPELADTATLNATYDLPPEASANCVVVRGRRGGAQPRSGHKVERFGWI